MTSHLPAVLAIAILVGCSPTAPPPPGPLGVRQIAVEQPVNRTGRALVVDDPGMIGRYLGERRATVPEQLAADLQVLLAERGFMVVAAGAGEGPALRTEILGWKPYSADYSMVTVDLVASLVDPATGRALWTAQRTNWMVPTPDARSSAGASLMASEQIARTLVEGWQPGPGTPDARGGR